MRSSSTSALQRCLLVAACALACAGAAARAQSTDASLPTPVFTNELGGRIAPRDVGDARLTRHFYTFNAAEGDLHVTVESADLNGDVDVFTAGTLRPLLKITLYAVGSAPTRVTKSVYLRRDETLVLRVEGRTVTDGDAQYRVRLDGAFRPAAGAPPQLAEAQPTAEAADAGAQPRGRRTTSTGARIPEPVVETPPQPAETPAAEEARTSEPERTEPAATPPTRRGGRRGTRAGSSRRTRPPASETRTERGEEERASGESGRAEDRERESAETPAAEPAPTRTPRARSSRRGGRTGARRAETQAEGAAGENSPAGGATSAAEAEAEPSPRLIIMTKDGELIARDMKSVRRVTVERGQIVVTGTDGKVERHPMSNVVRMAIEP